ncbi:hypothetical protein IP88_10065 [alpha proteobacterium AAP81b]|nr:hypothetical protein IP88_10065 [alpha proteobacterium AAP81b]
MRAVIDLPPPDVAALDALAQRNRRSRAAELRVAIRTHLEKADVVPEGAPDDASGDKDWIKRGAGYWAQREDIGDGLAYQRAIREDREFG